MLELLRHFEQLRKRHAHQIPLQPYGNAFKAFEKTLFLVLSKVSKNSQEADGSNADT
jgi:hypothetical protein